MAAICSAWCDRPMSRSALRWLRASGRALGNSPYTAFEEPRRDRHPQVGQHPATPRQIHWAVSRPLLTCGSLIDKFCLTPQAPPLP
jgi:hypothetical protein